MEMDGRGLALLQRTLEGLMARRFYCNQSVNSYKTGCRCEPCRMANRVHGREYMRRLRRPDSTWVPRKRVDPRECSRHIRWLHDNGIGVSVVADLARVDVNTIMDLRNDRKSYIYASTADRILAVGTNRAPSIGMVRARVDMLMAKGWTRAQIARASDVSERAITDLINRSRTKVWLRTAERVLAVDPTSHPGSR